MCSTATVLGHFRYKVLLLPVQDLNEKVIIRTGQNTVFYCNRFGPLPVQGLTATSTRLK